MKAGVEALAACSIGLLVAGAIWFAETLETRSLSDLAMGAAMENQGPPASAWVRRLEWSADGQTIISLARDGSTLTDAVSLHGAIAGTGAMPIHVCDQPISTIALAPDGRNLAVGTQFGTLCWVDLESLTATVLVSASRETLITSVAVSADGRLVVAGNSDGSLHFSKPSQRTSLTLPARRPCGITQICLSQDGKRLVVGCADGSICHWDIAEQSMLDDFNQSGGPVTAVAFLPGDERVIWATHGGVVRIDNLGTGREELRADLDCQAIRAVAVSPDGKTAAWGSYHRRIVIWDLERNEKKRVIGYPASILSQLRFSPDGTALAAAGAEGQIRIYDAQTWTEREAIDIVQSL